MMEDEPGQEPKSPQDARLDSLEERLGRAQAKEAERTGQAPKADASWIAVVPMPDEPPCTKRVSPAFSPPRWKTLCQTVK